MPPVLRSATLTINHEIDLHVGPPVVVWGRSGGKLICQLEINATGVKVYGPKGKELGILNWEQLVVAAQS